MRKVAVFFGGKSCEYEISILTGVMVLNLLDKVKYTVFPVYVDTKGGMYTSPAMFDVKNFRDKKEKDFQRIFFEDGSVYALNLQKRRVKPLAKIDVAINCCHGGWGEGGGVSALKRPCVPALVVCTTVRPARFSPTICEGEFPKSNPGQIFPPRSPASSTSGYFALYP